MTTGDALISGKHVFPGECFKGMWTGEMADLYQEEGAL